MNGRFVGTAMMAAALAATTPWAWANPKLAGIAADAPELKIQSNLLDEALAGGKSAGTKTVGPFAVEPASSFHRQGPKGTIAEVLVQSTSDAAVAAIRNTPGVRVVHVSHDWKRVTIELEQASAALTLATQSNVRMIFPVSRSQNNVGSVDGQANPAHRVDIAQNKWGLRGRGQKVGVISDSFNTTAGVRDADTTPAAGASGVLRGARNQDSGDLPPTVEILADIAEGSDEGAGMAELVYDIAPEAAIAFHTAFISESSFADGITRLRQAGSTVVVDDIIYFFEPMYQNGIIAQSAMNCVAAGVPYLSSAGNNANVGLGEVYRDLVPAVDNELGTPDGSDLHQWDNGTGFLPITVFPFQRIQMVLQWNQPFQSVGGAGSQIDLDMYATVQPTAEAFSNPALLIARSTVAQGTTGRGVGDALEYLVLTNTGTQPATFYLAIDHLAGSQDGIPQDYTVPVEFRVALFTCGGCIQIEGLTSDKPGFGAPTQYGHSSAPGVLAVGAVPFYDTPAYDINLGPTTAIDPQDFTSRGGRLPIYFDVNGNYAPVIVSKPEIAAVNGTNTTFFGAQLGLNGYAGEPDGRPNFFGTSASAPIAAAIVALVREIRPDMSPAQIQAALEQTAIDVTGRNAAVGWDDLTGAGLVDAAAVIDLVALGSPGPGTPVPTPTPTPSPTPAPARRVIYTYEGSSEGWQFSAPGAGFSAPDGAATDGALVLASRNNNGNTFGYYASPEFRVGAWQPGIGFAFISSPAPNSLFRARYTVGTNVADAAMMPTVRFRASTTDMSYTAEYQVSSTTGGGVGLRAGRDVVLDQYFSLPENRTAFRLFADLLNVGGSDDPNASLAIRSLELESIGVESLGYTIGTRTYDFRFGNQRTFRRSGAIPPFGPWTFVAPTLRVTDAGLTIGPGQAVSGNTVLFGFWEDTPGADPSPLRLVADRLYRATFSVRTNATTAQLAGTPAFRLRLNDATGNLAALVNIDSVGGDSVVPAPGTAATYSVWIDGRSELPADNVLRLAFDLVHLAASNNDPSISVTLEKAVVESYAKPVF